MNKLACLALLLASQLVHAADADTRRSGYAFMSPSTQALQNDDTQNPAMFWVQDGETLWQRKTGKANIACAGCHATPAALKGVAARYPSFDEKLQLPVNLAQRINLCRERHQQAPALPFESAELLGLEALVALQSRGQPVASPADPRLAPALQRGQQRFEQRIGQLNLSCAQCHDANAGKHLASSVIPQGHANAYPIYRLEWQAMGSLQRRLRNCMAGVRAEAPAFGAPELVELELYLAARASGMKMEAPGVRP